MSLANQKAKDAAMAARMKKLGIERRSANCPICQREVSLSGMNNHITVCRGR